MSDIAINPVTRRVQFTGNTGTGPFAFTFNILTDGDIAVYKNTTALTLTADYSVTINVNGTGSVTLVVALIVSDVLTIIGGRELSRTTDFVTAGDLLATSLNEQLDSNVIMAQQLDEKLGRGLYVNPGDVYTDLELPLKDARKGTVLGFNATTGDPEPGPEIGDVDSLAAISADIKTLAEIQDGTVATGAITTAAANITEIQNAPANAAIATTKAGEAAVSATAAEAAFDSFDDRYLGSKTANPTVDNDGNALVSGALYFNTTVSLMKVYTGSAWYTVGGPFVELSGGNMTGNLTFGDSDAIFMGAGNDLTIFHNGTDSYIQDQGTGNLIIGSDGTSISIHDFVGSQDMAKFTIGGSAELYHNGVKKIETTATGVDVTGSVVVSGTVDGRDVATDGDKLDLIEASADVTDATNVTAAGALMDSEITNLAAVKAIAATPKQIGKESIWIPAAAMYPSTTNPCSDLEQVETTALRPDLKVLDFAAAADDFAQFAISFPKSWNLGTITYQPFWTVTGTNTGTVVWQLGGVAITNDESIDTAFGTLVATTALAHSGTSNDLMVSAESGAVTIAGSPADNDQCFFQINNDASASGQTGVARLLGIKLFFTTDAANDV